MNSSPNVPYVTHITKKELDEIIEKNMAILEAADWRYWVAECHLHCSDFPSFKERNALEALDTALWLRDGSSYRNYLS